MKHHPVYISFSSLKNKTPIFHKPNGKYHQMRGLLMTCDPRHLSQSECVELPQRHAEKFARPCHNCYHSKKS